MVALTHSLQTNSPARLTSDDFKAESERIRSAYKTEESKAYAELDAFQRHATSPCSANRGTWFSR